MAFFDGILDGFRYSSVIQTDMLDRHQAGWMADFGEYLPFDSVLANGDAPAQHNQYPEQWAHVNRMAVVRDTHAIMIMHPFVLPAVFRRMSR